MKMAKASERDIEMALELSRTIEELMKGYFPDDGEQAVIFDPQDHYDCHKAIDLIFETACRGSLFRVVFGMAVVLDPRNEVVDPDSDVLELHPKHQKAIEQAEAYEQRIQELEALMVPDVRCKCCGYLVTESEHKGCLRAADATAPEGWKLVPDTLEDCGISCGYSPSVTGSCVPFVTVFMPEMDINDEAGWDRRNKIADALDPMAAAPKKEGE
jgi:hypothetical protein